MEIISYTKLRNNLAEVMNKVCENHEAALITRTNKSEVVMLSYEDYQSMMETMYLPENPSNASRLIESVDEINEILQKKKK